MSIRGLQRLVYGVEDVAQATRYFTDWGLEPHSAAPSGTDFVLPDTTGIQIRRLDDASLPPALIPGSTVRKIVWGVDSDQSVKAIAEELSKDRAVIARPPGIECVDPLGYTIGFERSTAVLAVHALSPANTIGNAVRHDRRADGATPRRITPRRMVHAVLWVPWAQTAMHDFYVQRLGFNVSETVRNVGGFLRGSGSHDHHNLFLQTKGANHGFQHVAFEVRDVDEVMLLGQYMEAQGWKSHLGPGRHVAGSNIYWYFECPAGGLVEAGCDLDYMTDNWEPLVHDAMPHGGSSWYVRAADKGLRPGHGEWPQWRAPQELT